MSGYLRKMARAQMKANRGLMNRTVRDHEDLLQNIEAVLVSAYRDAEKVDDAACHAAIESALTGRPAPDPISAMLANGLTQVRQVRSDVPNGPWQDALRVVAQSVRRHSTRQPGETNYLDFAGAFIA